MVNAIHEICHVGRFARKQNLDVRFPVNLGLLPLRQLLLPLRPRPATMRASRLVLELVANDVPPADHLSDGEDTVCLDRLSGINRVCGE